MKQTIDLIYRRTPSGQALTDSEGNPVRVEEILSRLYRIQEGHLVLVRLRADDGRHERMPFDMETLRSIQSRRIRGACATEGGVKVNVYNSNIRGEWPVLGATWDGIGLRWDAEGNPDNGDPAFRLCLLREVEPDEDFLEETPDSPAAPEGNDPGDPAPEEDGKDPEPEETTGD